MWRAMPDTSSFRPAPMVVPESPMVTDVTTGVLVERGTTPMLRDGIVDGNRVEQSCH